MTVYINARAIAKAFVAGILVIIAVMGTFGVILKTTTCPPRCATDNSVEIVEVINEAKVGMRMETKALCMRVGEILDANDVEDAIGGQDDVIFRCEDEICSEGGDIIVHEGSIEAVERAVLKATANCALVVSRYDCIVTITEY